MIIWTSSYRPLHRIPYSLRVQALTIASDSSILGSLPESARRSIRRRSFHALGLLPRRFVRLVASREWCVWTI
ncbi:hypothetical protein N7510_005067 [Penicillium lagena]|uniref:uncharacterized protein n=1 Tax=Penicillium lagena TaxID=94218 RepID=UPI0025401EAF|nr:uncharacterized protein N7510_005067 [Penicillium lagena]KAJ5621083.1 hypothetical protein N7510_005067 [Penicillium lagena]